ncbi:bifunctional adenosylcobinamide kinase/adenosylcobinamide-phosphate guanylyltransferase [Ruegeria sp. 6PALISEP08]|uniref:bifunctional adenosylcobinamide kinase/adenosylcobinamide-phosphate guanylyltransferase n=1 Tax=Ruegeria sp. 6PALISEP08 TaxID=1225660 RepID=UPI00067F678B|nr:bifunctional adenosylcobinamide kinase/adenosylcobinamide-phosphate guanylyltransferase [Ruegeria sp. 6PALISEP08]
MSPDLTLVLGGAASGKSAFAEERIVSAGKSRVYLATSQVFDDEMRQKVDRHLVQRGDGWTTVEEPLDLGPVLARLSQNQICLIDCATMWLSNHLLADSDLDTAQTDLLDALSACPTQVVIVSNEVGHGIVPDNALARRFREAQGRLNIALAAQADLVVQVTAGLPLVLKGQLP